MATGKLYLQVKPKFSNWQKNRVGPFAEEMKIEKLVPVAVTASAPSEPRQGCVVIELSVDVDDAVFYPLRPKVDVKVPAVTTPPVAVTAEPVRGRAKRI